MVEISFFSFSFFFRGGEREREEEIGREKQKKTLSMDECFRFPFFLCFAGFRLRLLFASNVTRERGRENTRFKNQDFLFFIVCFCFPFFWLTRSL